MGKVLAPRNVHPKMVPLIKCVKVMWFSKYLIFPKSNYKGYTKEKYIFFWFFEPEKD